MSEDAINDVSEVEEAAQGTEEVDESQSKTSEPDERTRRLAEISRQKDEAEGIVYDEAEQDGSDGEAEEQADEPAEDLAAKQDSDPLAELGYYRNDNGDLVTKLKVNGVEREVLAEQVKAYMQKDLAGDWKLQQAAERERQLQQMAEALQRERAEAQRQSTQNQPPEMGAEEAEQQARAVLEKIWDGDDKEATKALAALLRRDNTTVDVDAIRQEAERAALSSVERREQERLAREWDAAVDRANDALWKDHPEIYEDENLSMLVNERTKYMVRAANRGDPEFANMTPEQMLRQAAASVQGWLDGRTGKPVTSERENRKEGLKPMPRGLDATKSPRRKEEVDNSPAAIIQRMRAARAVV